MTGKKLRREREKRGLNQTDFGALLGISQVQVSRYERADDRIIRARFETVQRIAKTLRALPVTANNERPPAGRTADGR